ncbi:conserved hypothetical protein [Culex quinquefasciatus]|uniref:Uncharacterized protein n=1 Tax=Culex quinquefasciatus TaxID=7176 RepID=B0XAV7_CULQU|nr:conserved hypothetical protein [Culex quinquefasciatus]|eukprot:XP_001866779.1 conserved hypothetical protein [Culex quinquefasciatus]
MAWRQGPAKTCQSRESIIGTGHHLDWSGRRPRGCSDGGHLPDPPPREEKDRTTDENKHTRMWRFIWGGPNGGEGGSSNGSSHHKELQPSVPKLSHFTEMVKVSASHRKGLRLEKVGKCGLGRWSTKEKPTEEDFKQFALFLSGRRPYTIDNILDNKQHLLQSWRGKEVSLLLHVYSLSVSNRSQWIKVKDTLIDPIEHDRAGAATTQALQELTEKLRSDHGKFLKGHDMAWSFWANAIHSAPAHQRSTMMQYPPESLASLFSIQEGVRMNAVRHELEAASNVNESYHDDIVEVRKAFEAFKVTLNRGLQALDDRITRLETREHTSSSLINSMKTSVVVQEDAVGKNLNKKVSNCIDDQHSP